MTSIPVIDISPLQNESDSALRSVGKELRSASENDGFFYVAGHGVDTDVISSTFETSKHFFSLPKEKKVEIQMSDTHRGFLSIGGSTMEGYSSADQKESFIWGIDEDLDNISSEDQNQLIAPNRWPNEPADMRWVLNTFFDEVHNCSRKILRALAVSLNESPDFFTRNFNRPTSRGSLIYYPATEENSNGYGVSPHSDFGCLSMLLQGGPGLSAQSADGNWYEVNPIPNTFVVNIGDLLSRWSNGRFRSVPHFVVNKGGQARYSIVVFVDPDSQTVIDPILHKGETAQFEPITCDAYISGRFNRSFAYRN
ncbi:MAG: isopenicillin N synthase family oxygenase [Gammaproteobacteria bacterium]|nr:isopenicillin N synthase family oxygenase [Gammaproteobacteria bacterium]